jgi:hypothetical protein
VARGEETCWQAARLTQATYHNNTNASWSPERWKSATGQSRASAGLRAEASARRGARQIEASRWPPCAPTCPIASMHLSGLRALVASIDQRGQCIGMHLRASLLFDAPFLAAQRSTRCSRSAEGSNLGASTQLTSGMKSPAHTAHERPGGVGRKSL